VIRSSLVRMRRLSTNDDRITLTGTDLDLTFEADVPARIETEGETAIPYATLAAFCAAAKSTEISLELAGHSVTVKSGRSRIGLSAVDPRDFPNVDQIEGDLVTVDIPTITKALRFCAAAASESEARYYLQGPFVQETGDDVTIWGTDGHAMHRAVLPQMPKLGSAILPMGAVNIILTMADKADELRMRLSDNGWAAQVAGLRAWGKVIEGTFPDCQRIMDSVTDLTEIAVSPRDDFANALSVAACGAEIVDEKTKGLIIKAVTGQPIIVRGGRAAADVTQAGRAEMEAEARGDAAFRISSLLLSQAVNALGAEDIALLYNGDLSAILEPVQQSATINLRALVMGMRASEAELADV
jgi:DNA polymerase III sliding clamp (beta) subunit (PCNA family)